VDARWCLVHATHVTHDEVSSLAASGAVTGLCPITEANLGDGLFPLAELQGQEGRYAIGSDSNVLISVSEELRLLEYGQRLRDCARNVMATDAHSTGRAMFDAALRGGHQASGVGRDAEPGLVVGAPADFVSLRDDASLVARSEDQILDTLIFASPRGLVDCVWRAGRKVVSGGVHVERAQIEARFRRTLSRLLAS
jgi:formimidoylglutamate deiminase